MGCHQVIAAETRVSPGLARVPVLQLGAARAFHLVSGGIWRLERGLEQPKAERSSKATPYPTEEVREDLSIIPRREYLFNLMLLVPLHQVPRAQIYASASESHAELPRCLAAVSDKPFLDSSQF